MNDLENNKRRVLLAKEAVQQEREKLGYDDKGRPRSFLWNAKKVPDAVAANAEFQMGIAAIDRAPVAYESLRHLRPTQNTPEPGKVVFTSHLEHIPEGIAFTEPVLLRATVRVFGNPGESSLEFLDRIYWREGGSFPTVTRRLGISETTLKNWLIESGLGFREKHSKEARALISHRKLQKEKRDHTPRPSATQLRMRDREMMYADLEDRYGDRIAFKLGIMVAHGMTVQQISGISGIDSEKLRKIIHHLALKPREGIVQDSAEVTLVRKADELGLLGKLSPRQQEAVFYLFPQQGEPLSYRELIKEHDFKSHQNISSVKGTALKRLKLLIEKKDEDQRKRLADEARAIEIADAARAEALKQRKQFEEELKEKDLTLAQFMKSLDLLDQRIYSFRAYTIGLPGEMRKKIKGETSLAQIHLMTDADFLALGCKQTTIDIMRASVTRFYAEMRKQYEENDTPDKEWRDLRIDDLFLSQRTRGTIRNSRFFQTVGDLADMPDRTIMALGWNSGPKAVAEIRSAIKRVRDAGNMS